MGELKVTSIKLDTELWTLVQIEALKRGITTQDLVDKALKRELHLKPTPLGTLEKPE